MNLRDCLRIAPNGTGKSSIAAAIAIGLGFSVKVRDVRGSERPTVLTSFAYISR